MSRHIKQGNGWRIGWDAAAPEFPGLVGAETWAIELTEAEFNDFCQLVGRLAEAMQQIAGELMAEEAVSCEVESERLWLEAEGYAQSYGLRMIVLSGRRCEGQWDAIATPPLIQATQTLTVF
ncbi:MAG: DUF1818 family protein [Leptolyngbyaceae cyanobacterium SL_7_1]|nr:DUF1818 family protein [Leptolyngbyaceae cyanobacterium SL_7_1]